MTAIADVEVEGRSMPWAESAEESVLGTVMAYEYTLDEVITVGLTAESFYRPAHQAAFAAILRLAEAGNPTGWVAVLNEMKRDRSDRSLPDHTYLSRLTLLAMSASVTYHAGLILDAAAKRRAILAGQRILAAGWSPDKDAGDVQALAEEAVAGIAAPTDETTWATIGDVMAEVRAKYDDTKRRGTPDGIRWGYIDVDKAMAPMQPGDLAVVVAWPGAGKSLVTGNLALEAAVKQGKRALLHSMEMTRLEVGQRYAAKTGSIRLEAIIAASLTPEQEAHLDWAMAQVADAPLVIDSSSSITLSRLRASIRKHKAELVIVDQIPIMVPEDSRAPREQQVATISYGLKRMAEAENCVIVACAQVNSEPMKRADKRPTLQDIRESRAPGQAANIAVFLHDPTFGEREHPRVGEIEWIIEKTRQGAKDILVLAAQFHYARLANPA